MTCKPEDISGHVYQAGRCLSCGGFVGGAQPASVADAIRAAVDLLEHKYPDACRESGRLPAGWQTRVGPVYRLLRAALARAEALEAMLPDLEVRIGEALEHLRQEADYATRYEEDAERADDPNGKCAANHRGTRSGIKLMLKKGEAELATLRAALRRVREEP